MPKSTRSAERAPSLNRCGVRSLQSLRQGELWSVLCQGSLPAFPNGSYASEPSLEASFYCFPNSGFGSAPSPVCSAEDAAWK